MIRYLTGFRMLANQPDRGAAWHEINEAMADRIVMCKTAYEAMAVVRDQALGADR